MHQLCGGDLTEYTFDPVDQEVIVEISLTELYQVQTEARNALGGIWNLQHEKWCVDRHRSLFHCTTQEANRMHRGIRYRSWQKLSIFSSN